MKIFLIYSIVYCVLRSITKQVRCNLLNKTPDNELIVGKVYEEILSKDRSKRVHIFKHVTVLAKNHDMNTWYYTITFAEYNPFYNVCCLTTTCISGRYIILVKTCK
jgi:hypothetical protein